MWKNLPEFRGEWERGRRRGRIIGRIVLALVVTGILVTAGLVIAGVIAFR